MILVTKWFGSFLCDESKVKRAALFPKDPEAIAQRLEMMRKGELLEEEQNLASSADKVADRRLRDFGPVAKFDSSFIKPEVYGFSIDLYRQATIILAKRAVKESVGPDVHLGQAVRAYGDLVFTSNMLSERLHEWYGLHFPELENVLGGEAYAKAISEHGSRAAVLSALKLNMESIGSDVQPEDLDSVRMLAHVLSESQNVKTQLEKYMERRMKEVAPNISSLVGPVIGARLIMHAGSLKRLASMPSGTIQLLGAEKAMFRHLKEGSRPPKHGVLFMHPLVHNAPPWQRGAISRTIASKLCLAARADAYSHNDISELLKEQIAARLIKIKEQKSSPPRKKGPGPGRRDKRRPR